FARHLVEPLISVPSGFVTVPGNHDLYLQDSVDDGRFEKHFGDLLRTDLPQWKTDDFWPLVRLPRENVAIIAINSARPNPQPWRSSGRIPSAQMAGFARILREEPLLRERFVIIVTHYAPRLPDGRPDARHHGLENAEDLLSLCASIPRGMLTHGHIHHRF